MCGIFGVFGKPSSLPSRTNCEAALATLAHRGPDARGLVWNPERGLALGHARLSIIDPGPRSDQPFESIRGKLIFNGEIYNYRILRDELIRLGSSFRTSSDSEVILRGYEQWGEEIFERLRGMYSLALYDERERRLHLVRDEFGIKPLCIFQRGDVLIFASEIKAIAALQSLSVDGAILTDMLTWGFQMDDLSLYSGIRFLSPGTILSADLRENQSLRSQVRECRRPQDAYTDLPAAPYEAQSLRRTITDSVKDHLISDVPVAIALSGGLDSSVVTAAAAGVHRGLHAFTFTLSSEVDPEVEHARLLCKHLGLEHHVARLISGSTEGWLRRVAWHLEEPIANVNSLVSYGLAAVVRAQGFKVILMGEGADELFAGYPWYRLALEPRFKANPEGLFDAYHKRRAQATLIKVLRPAVHDISKARLLRQRQAFCARLSKTNKSALDGFLSFDQSTQLQYSQLLRVDRMFMAHGVEARVPFLYRSVLSASAVIPNEARFRVTANGQRDEKVALAESFAAFLPAEILKRPKFGNSGTVNLWNTSLVEGLSSEFDRCVHGEESRGARQLLEEFIDWKSVASLELTDKEKFTLALTVEAVDSLLLSRRKPDEPLPVQWDILN